MPKLTARLTRSALAAPARGRVVLRFTANRAARVTLAMRRAGKRVLLVNRAAKRGANAIVLRAPARVGRYDLVLTARAAGKSVVLRGRLTVKAVPRK